MEIVFTDFLIKAGAATLAGLCMGLERQIKGKPAGLKTNILVALGATIFVMISTLFHNEPNADLTRIIGQIIVGVGFLGAGVIIKQKKSDKIWGLATAATIWCSAAAGCLAGLGIYNVLAGFTVLVVIINLIFGYFGKKVHNSI
ncbi:MgtC/SapB family protein [Haloflavibacter putidus]|uniref:MgtC/SapB family protein n=1 Tax=Haloflavibacter putidus TaxID=2576776 RepID=A0A507ZV39_9FLAO|nr:MgtC/SapB family protein [Haloflavibacter putidus]TQD40114.1 MgtC/SapB family protein [Haloflavibacter putidus]